jgi:hypothetical protein
MYSQFSVDDYIFYCFLKQNVSVLNGTIYVENNIDEINISWQLTNLPFTLLSYANDLFIVEIEMTSAQENLTLGPFNVTYWPDVESSYNLRKNCDNTLDCIQQELLPFTDHSINLKFRLEYDGETYFLPIGTTSFYSTSFQITNAIRNATGIIITWVLLGYCPEFLPQIEFNVSCNNWNNVTPLSPAMFDPDCQSTFPAYNIYISSNTGSSMLQNRCIYSGEFIKY